jgi:hypothetical protein
MSKVNKYIIIENAENFDKIKNIILSVGDIYFGAESDDGRDIHYEISINDKIIADHYLEDIIREIHWNHLEVKEGSGLLFIEDDKIKLNWSEELHINSFENINEFFFKELSNALSIPKAWDINYQLNCYFEFEGEIKKKNEINFTKFIFSVYLFDYSYLISDTSKNELKKFREGYVFHPDNKFQIVMNKIISKIILRTGIKESTFIISGNNSLNIFSVYPNESKTYDLTLI